MRGMSADRRGGPSATHSASGMHARRLVADAALGGLWVVDIAPGASGRGPLFDARSAEVVTVLDGVLDLDIGGRVETLQEGDSVVLDRAIPAGWANPSTHDTRVMASP